MNMNNVLTEMDGQMIARSAAVRARALATLQSARHVSTPMTLPPLLAIFIVTIGLVDLQINAVAKIVLSVACGLSFCSAAMAWHFQRQLTAITDLVLQDEYRQQ
jgi:hypothetical protein